VSLAIDDFGTGYSCLSYLPKLPFDELKIDRSFVNELGERREVDAMVHSLVMLAHNLGMRVIAEGVETQEQMALITEIGCDEAQGYLLGRPTSGRRRWWRWSSCAGRREIRDSGLRFRVQRRARTMRECAREGRDG
jgi:EAL domain-containing protein (putative c-di-GMP-specific phosphodiesterase class I)